MMANKPPLDEFSWIAECLKPLATHPGALELKDDAAILLGPSFPLPQEWVISTDTAVEGVHFLQGTLPEQIARKCFRASQSDLSAMGACPVGYFFNLTRPSDLNDAWLNQFVSTLKDEQEELACSLLGGDTTSTLGPLVITFTVVGSVPQDEAIRRSGAQLGDLIYVTGPIGDSALGVRCLLGQLEAAKAADFVKRHFMPPRHQIFAQKARRLISSAIDISDGLIADLNHLAQASKVKAEIEIEKVPFSSEAQELLDVGKVSFADLLTGGEDYELIITVPLSHAEKIEALARELGVSLYKIGKMLPIDNNLRVSAQYKGQSVSFSCKGFSHF